MCTCNNKAVDNNTSKVPDTDDDNVIVQLESDDVYDDAISVDIYSVGKYSDNARVLINGQELINDAPGYIDYVFIYKIDDVYVLRMNNTTDQCGTDYILLFNDKGQVLFDYTKYQSTTLKVDKVNKVVTVDVYEGEDCWCCEGMNINKDTRTIKIDGKNAVLEK